MIFGKLYYAYGHMGSVLDTVDWEDVWWLYVYIPWTDVMEFLVCSDKMFLFLGDGFSVRLIVPSFMIAHPLPLIRTLVAGKARR